MKKKSEGTIIIYTDGGARNNPGPAGIGVIIEIPGKKIKEYGEYIGETTNNVAEYTAIIFALKKLKHLLGGEKAMKTNVLVKSDSELIVSQLLGKYKIFEDELKPLFINVWNLKQDFKRVEFEHVPREQNKEADRLVNEAIDKKLKNQSLF